MSKTIREVIEERIKCIWMYLKNPSVEERIAEPYLTVRIWDLLTEIMQLEQWYQKRNVLLSFERIRI